jgi:hypothetical protein
VYVCTGFILVPGTGAVIILLVFAMDDGRRTWPQERAQDGWALDLRDRICHDLLRHKVLGVDGQIELRS